jgi:hypothetical protein
MSQIMAGIKFHKETLIQISADQIQNHPRIVVQYTGFIFYNIIVHLLLCYLWNVFYFVS